VGTTAVNGTATTFMRSDAAPPIDLTFSPTWTGFHTFATTNANENNISATTTTLPASPPANGFTPNSFTINGALTTGNSQFALYGYTTDTGTATSCEGGGVLGRYTCNTTSASTSHAMEARNDTKGTAVENDGLFVFMNASQASFTNSQDFNGIFIRPEVYLANDSTPSTTGINAGIRINPCVGGSQQYSILAANAISAATINGSIGYAVGLGTGTGVVQGTSRTTGVTINNPTGAIQLFSAAGIATYTTFIVTDSKVAANDEIIFSIQNGSADTYNILPAIVTAGAFKITFADVSGVTVETPIFNFSVVKGSGN
jgi:hypothetical protein